MTASLIVTFGAYGLGALLGLAADHGGSRIRRDWPIYLRIQLVATAVALTLFSTWELTTPRELVAPVLIASAGWILLTVAMLLPPRRSAGSAALEAWAAIPNGTFWVQPIAAALGGVTASMIAALSNAVYSGSVAVSIHLLRRDAPVRQRRITTWADQSAIIGVVAGLALHLVGPAPDFSHVVLRVAGPILAFVGAALFTGSVLHPLNVGTARTATDLVHWAVLSMMRIVWLVPIAVFTSSRAVAIIALLSAFGAPAFNPPQLAVLYGYRSGVVNIAIRWGWVLLPIGFVAALMVSH